MNNKELLEEHNKLIDFLTKNMTETEKEKLFDLLEIERELTLREG